MKENISLTKGHNFFAAVSKISVSVKVMKTLISICLGMALLSCKKNSHVSDCIESKVDEFKSSVVCPNGASVKEYSFQGKLVYVFANGDCISDGDASVFDADCEYLSSLGGFAGNTKIKGVDFGENANYKRTIWHN